MYQPVVILAIIYINETRMDIVKIHFYKIFELERMSQTQNISQNRFFRHI